MQAIVAFFLTLISSIFGLKSIPSPTPILYTCGGIRGLVCPTGYGCQMTNNYPDAIGTCVAVSVPLTQETYCQQDTDCIVQTCGCKPINKNYFNSKKSICAVVCKSPVCKVNRCILNDTSTNYTCPISNYIDCMPKIDSPPNPQCNPEFLAWAKANCPGFQGAAY